MNHRLLSFCVSAAAFATAFHSAPAQAAPWSFGVMDDTQWTCADPASQNANGVPVSIINQINPQFISAGVKFVIQVGDLTENGNDADEAVRAAAAKPLLDAGIGFFPMRGNHETYASPAGVNSYAIPAFQSNYPQTRGLSNTFGAANFSSPTSVSSDLDGMSYSFDYATADSSARFVILDSWATPSKKVTAAGYDYGYSFADQQSWISGQLDKTKRGTQQHAFVFSHQPLIAENHQDSPFVGYTNANTDMQNAFFASLATNNVKYYISGHDHIHQRSLIASPDNNSFVEEIIGASNSSKFYTPKATSDSKWYGQKVRETSLSQELYTVGYYIYTVDGPRVTVDYYSDDHGNWSSDASYPGSGNGLTLDVTPTFHFVKKETFGYSLNGQSFLVPQGQPYTTVQDSIASGSGFKGSSAGILGGVNGSTKLDGSSRQLTKQINTGWTPTQTGLASDVLSVWGLQEIGATQTDSYVLSLSYDPSAVTTAQVASGAFALASKDSFGHWVNAVDMNKGGVRHFVSGAYSSSYPLGTCGVDSASHTVWAVVNHQGDFAAKVVNEVVNFIYTSDNHYGIYRPIFRGNYNVTGQTVNEAMIARMNTLPTQSFPSDGGVAAGQTVGQVDFLMDTGDIANRSESNKAIAANQTLSYPGLATYNAPASSVSWGQWQADFLGAANTGNSAGGLLTLTNSQAQGIPVFLSPGNHDISNAIGMTDKTPFIKDATSFVQIYNRMTPYTGKAPISTSVFANTADYANINLQVNYSFDVGGTHVLCVNMFPDKNILNWMTADLANVAASTPVLLFCHAPLNMAAGETKVFGNPASPTSTWAGDIPFALNNTDSATSYVDMNAAKQYVADWLIAHPNVRALFSGHDNFNGATPWNGQDPNGNLIATRDAAWPGVELFRVDSPMKGDFSGLSATNGIGDEKLLSFQVYSYDIATRRLTEREFLWNNTADATGNGIWSSQSATIDLSLSPTTAATLAGPANDSTVTAAPTLAWSSVYAATGYTVAVTSPNNTVASYDVTGTSLTLGTLLTNGLYTWTVKANNIEGSGPVSATGNFTLLLPPTLSISAPDANGNVNVSWPASNATGYHLEFSPDMTNWVPVSPTGFFRLVKP